MKRTERRAAAVQRRPYIAAFYRGNRLVFVLALAATAITSCINLGIAWLMQQTMDAVSRQPGALPLTTLAWLTLGLLGVVAAVKLLSQATKPRFSARAMMQYKSLVFERLTDKEISSFGRENTAVYLSALTNDAASVEAGYLESSFDFVFDLVMIAGAFTMMLLYSPLMTVVAVLLFCLPIGASLVAGKRIELLETRISGLSAGLVATLKDALTGFPVVKSFGAEKAMQALFKKSDRQLEKAKCTRSRLRTMLSALGAMAALTAQLGTFLVGAWLALSGRGISPGVLLIFIDLTGSAINPITQLPELLARRKASLALVDRLAAALKTNVRDEDEDIPPQLACAITLKHVSFGYEESSPVLQGLCARFEAGKSYAIVGGSGCGKSTLLELLMGSHSNYTGSICYDGHEVRSISSRSLFDLASMIRQQVFIFDDTLQNNVTLFQPFDRDAVEQAVCMAGLTAVADRLGTDRSCGENGCELSGGERQRIAIARSLLRRSPVLLADESTSALDAATAAQVTDALLGLQGITRIVVTHTLDASALRRYDSILLLKGGHIVEQGSFDTLIAQKGDFYALYTAAH